jgi:polyisoprenoid-binding protein YceI
MTSPQQPVFDGASLIRDIAGAGEWTLERQASRVEFAVKHFWGLVTVRGGFASLDGAAQVISDGTVTASLIIDAATVDTKQKQRDKHLRSGDFFDAEHHPRLEVRVDDVTLTSPSTATGRGKMTVAGKTEPVSFDATIRLSADGQQATVQATFEVDRTRFGMTWSPMRTAAATAVVTAYLVFRHTKPSAG